MSIDSINAAFAKAFGESVIYRAKACDPLSITSIRSISATNPGYGQGGNALKTISFALSTADVPLKPEARDVISAADGDWLIKQVDQIAENSVWHVVVERTGR